jgi:L(+)-tartrate dehydratase alpha subunit
MITVQDLEEAAYKTIARASTSIPPDIRGALEEAKSRENVQSAREAYESTLQSLQLSELNSTPACPDTGWPLFFVKVGTEAAVEGGMLALEEAATRMVAQATREGLLRSTMKHPLTGYDPGDNTGTNMPHFKYSFVPGNELELTFVPKGGGSECFGGTRHRVVAFADGLTGIKKFVVDAYAASARAGAVCPPAVLGVGIGGTADVAAELAKQAACLRVVGSRHPEKQLAELELELTSALNKLGIGIMGSGGTTSVLAVNVEYSYTHIAGVVVATSTSCCITRRATTAVAAEGKLCKLDDPNWFERSQKP